MYSSMNIIEKSENNEVEEKNRTPSGNMNLNFNVCALIIWREAQKYIFRF